MSGIGFGTLLFAVMIRETINATLLNPWKIFEQTRDKMQDKKPEAPKVTQPK